MSSASSLHLFFGFFATALAVLVSEVVGRGTVLYNRIFSLLGMLAVLCLAHACYFFFRGEGGAAVALWLLVDGASAIAALMAWFGFRVHLSNSITLNLVSMLETPRTAAELYRAYDVPKRTAERLRALREGGYLDAQGQVASGAKIRVIFFLLWLARGNRRAPL